MRRITIKRCPECSRIGARADEIAAELREEMALDVDVIDGRKGEFTVLVDGDPVVRKQGDPPSIEDALDAVRNAQPAPSAG
ncbi:MAG TPA: hypothetical protein VNC50_07260 [Planctomycetia bacterium]|nr:hypothetical protein [Planctomycetia bacterium]